AACTAIKALFKPARQSLDHAKRTIASLEAALLDGFEQADRLLRAKVTAYHVERRRQAEAERRAREAAERKRREDAQVEQAARLENLARATGEAHYQRAAEMVLNQPTRTPPVQLDLPAVPGFSFREETRIEVADLGALVAAVAAGQVDLAALLPNESWLRTEAVQRGTTVKDGDLLFPGVLVTKTPDVTVRTK
ncbi:MAG TPA: hypothetical protein VFN64_07060, partial [Burkholderiaceae bacterium]|nr:hypothetical protein [Burkholderiaceae bacterium]